MTHCPKGITIPIIRCVWWRLSDWFYIHYWSAVTLSVSLRGIKAVSKGCSGTKRKKSLAMCQQCREFESRSCPISCSDLSANALHTLNSHSSFHCQPRTVVIEVHLPLLGKKNNNEWVRQSISDTINTQPIRAPRPWQFIWVTMALLPERNIFPVIITAAVIPLRATRRAHVPTQTVSGKP